jgi:photosystem II stability/assembly factor-like uncharacterized protein
MTRTLISLLLCLAVTLPASAAWTRAGLFGADVRAMVLDPDDPDLVFIGTSQGEVYASTDGGRRWQPARGGIPFPGYVVDNLVIDGKGRLWAASWGLWDGGVIAVSEDRGVNWTRRDQGLEDFSVRAIAVDPSNADHLVVGGLTGVYRTKNGGRKWEKISEQINVESLAIDPRSPDRIYVGTWRQAFRTTNGGKSWKLIAEGMVLDTDVFAITIDPKNPDNIWLSTCGWVYNSTDGGDKWVRYKEGFNNRRIHSVAIDPRDSNVVYAGSVAGLYCTRDLGKTWEVVSDEGLVINAIGIHPKRPDRILLATEGDGMYRSDDGGRTFARTSEGLRNVRIAAIAPDPLRADRLFAAVLFGGSSSGIYRSDNAGSSWQKVNSTRLPEVLSLIVRKDGEPRFLAGTEQGVFFSSDGAEWTRAEPALLPVRVAKIVPFNRSRLFAATSEGVFTSRDGGKSWYRLANSNDRSGDLALGRFNGARALFALKATGLSVFDGNSWSSIAGAPQRGRALALASDGDRQILVVTGVTGVRAGYVTDAKEWREVEVPKVEHATALTGERATGSTAYLAARDSGRIFISDNAADWRSIDTPLRLTDVAAIASDPFDPRRIYLGTAGQGLFIYDPVPSRLRGNGSYSAGGGSK